MTVRENDLRKVIINNIGVINLSAPGIYSIKNKTTGAYYIGQSINVIKRLVDHCNGANSNHNDKDVQAIDKAIKNLGVNAFEFAIEASFPNLFNSDDLKETLNQAEHQYIAKYDSKNKGYNKTCGNHKHKYDNEYGDYVLSVPFKMIRDILKVYNIYNNKDENVLFINYFDTTYKKVLEESFGCTVMTIATIPDNVEDSKHAREQAGQYILKELNNMNLKDFDIIISNPPYGKIGAQITDKINKERKNESTFINIMPINDYLRVNKLWQYVDIDSKIDADFFKYGIAGVTSDIVKINKQPKEYFSKDVFEIETYRYEGKNVYKKYFYETRRRHHYAIDASRSQPKVKFLASLDVNVNNSFGLHFRDINHLGDNRGWGKENCITYKWNISRSIDKQYILDNYCNTGHSTFGFIKFNTENERDNFTDFMYNNGFKFFERICKIADPDSSIMYSKIMPKVDWTRAWTIEEVLKNYGYTDIEVKEIMDDLN